ncbi:MAG: trehalose-6-phosphate synthase [Acidimicrobiales bacterium]
MLAERPRRRDRAKVDAVPNASSPSSSSDPSSSDPAPSPSRPAAPVSGGRPVVLVSNRGPVAFRLADDGALIGRRGAGGLVSGLAPLVTGTDATWIAAAMSDGDRAAADEGVLEADGLRVRLLDLDPDAYRLAYDVVCNATLWFMHHGLWDLPRSPAFGAAFSVAWEAYRAVNAAFADAIVAGAPTDAAVLVQDYHLALVAAMVGDRRPDLRLVHFSHTPFAGPDLCRVLPTSIRRELLGGMRAFAACGFHTERWAASFRASCIDVVGDVPDTFVAPLGPDPDDIAATATSPACAAAPGTGRSPRGSVAHHPRGPHRAVEEHRARVRRLRRPARAARALARAGRAGGVRLPVARGRARVPALPRRGRRRGTRRGRPVAHRRLGADHLRRLRRLPGVGGGVGAPMRCW